MAAATAATGWILGPVVAGYGTPLVYFGEATVGQYRVALAQQIYGCFLAATGEFYEGFRYSESNPTWGGDDPEVCAAVRRQGLQCGELLGHRANHYETTWGQEARYPEYFAQKVAEGLPWP